MEFINSLLVKDNTLFFVIILLQIITMIFLLGGGGKKQKREPKSSGRRPSAPSSDGKGGRKDAHVRGKNNNLKKTSEVRSVRPQQQSKPQQSQPSAIDPMEKSLRDINLRLKNAEREQESARKKIHQESGPGPRSNGRPENQNRPQQRPPIQRVNGGRDDRPPRREFNRGGPPMQEHPQRPAPVEPEFGGMPQQQQAPEMIHDGGMHEQADMQHGRRFTAKRRQLPENPEETGAVTPPPSMPPEPSTTPPPANDTLDNALDNAREDAWGR
ncbi:MAG: hypothetical protein LBU70_00670 [Chitinispirillales bacterium]|jgi:hypothetical protein|nr:hypothetical protein [Chitinispirillales bacterium]